MENIKGAQVNRFKHNIFTGVALLAFILISGCATTHKTTTTTETTERSDSSQAEKKSVSTDSNQPNTTVVEKNTTTTTSETKPEHTGLLGGIFHVIGSVIALPFIFIGGLFRMIF